MPEFDHFCFLCYAGFHNPLEVDEEEDYDEDTAEMRKIFPFADIRQRLDWASNFRTIGVNRNATGLKQCYLSGRAVEEELGTIIEPGDHPNAQNLQLEYDGEVSLYNDANDDGDGDLPIHESCLTVLCEAFAQARGLKYHWNAQCSSTTLPFDLDTLFTCLASVRRQGFQSCLDLGHELDMEQSFWIQWNEVYYYLDPLDQDETSRSRQRALERALSPTREILASKADKYQAQSADFFSGLPKELVVRILDFVSVPDMPSCLLASRAILEATRSDHFWTRRMRIDAPWYWEAAEDGLLDAHREYNDVMTQALKPVELAKRGQRVDGLANRRRIWQVAQEVVRLYELADDPVATKPSVFEEDATCRYAVRVARPRSSELKKDTNFFFTTAADMTLTKRIQFHWSGAALCGISVAVGDTTSICGDCSSPAEARHDLVIAADDWLEKLVFNISTVDTSVYNSDVCRRDQFVSGVSCYTLSGKRHEFGDTQGSKRLFEPPPGKGIVGLRTELADGRFTRFAIIEHAAIPTKSRTLHDEKRLDFLWKNELPSRSLRFQGLQSGYWSGDGSWDLVPMELLKFGNTEEELSTLVGFGSSPDCRSLEVYREDGSKQRIGGNVEAMKTMRIDGPGGERVGGFKFVIGALCEGIVITTNHGRQAIFGKSNDNARTEHTPDPGFGLAGIYCSFNYNSNLLSSLALVQSPDFSAVDIDPASLMDETGLMWELQPPPPSWRSIGPVYGDQHRGAVAKTVDFSRPVTKIEGLLAAPQWLDLIELGGWTIHYGDGSDLEPTATFGHTSWVWPQQPDATVVDLRSMQRHESMAMFAGHDSDTVTPVAHATTDEEALSQASTWDLGASGEKLVAVTVWSGDYLNGIQFHSETGRSSPRWGKCGNEPAATIRIGGEESVVGLKVMLGTSRLGYVACCDVPQAVQAMGKPQDKSSLWPH